MAKLIRRKSGGNPATLAVDKIAITFLTGVYEALFSGQTKLSNGTLKAAYSYLAIVDQFPDLVKASEVGFRLIDLPASGHEDEVFEYGEYIVRGVYHGSSENVNTLTWRELTFIEKVSIQYEQELPEAFRKRLDLFRGISEVVSLESEEGDIQV